MSHKREPEKEWLRENNKHTFFPSFLYSMIDSILYSYFPTQRKPQTNVLVSYNERLIQFNNSSS